MGTVTITTMSTTSITIAWSTVSSATGYYVSYDRRDFEVIITPKYMLVDGGSNGDATISDLEPGTMYRIRVWATNGASVSSQPVEAYGMTFEEGVLPWLPSPPCRL